MMSAEKKAARTTERGQIQPIRSVDQDQHKHMYALMVRLHDRQPSECIRSGFCASVDAQEKAGTCQIASALRVRAGVMVRHKGHDAQIEVQAAPGDDMEGSRPTIGGSCISQEDVSTDIPLRASGDS